MSTTHHTAAWLIAGATLIFILAFHLLAAFFAGLIIYHLVHALAASLRIKSLSHRETKLLAIALIALLVIVVVMGAVAGVASFLNAENGGLSALLAKLADILERSRANLPAWVTDNFPRNSIELQNQAAVWLREHARELSGLGKETGRVAAHILIGIALSVMASMQEAVADIHHKPFVGALICRLRLFSTAFGNVVGAQTKIATVNAFITWLYLGLVLPLLGVKLPFVITLVVVTFIVGLIPVIGNVISNTAVVLVSLGRSFEIAVTSMIFLILIHKLEYFLNAKIVGAAIKARSWELLVAILMFEAAFGMAGMIAAPVYYAYIKSELYERGAI